MSDTNAGPTENVTQDVMEVSEFAKVKTDMVPVSTTCDILLADIFWRSTSPVASVAVVLSIFLV